MVRVLTSSVVDHWWVMVRVVDHWGCNGSCGRSLVV